MATSTTSETNDFESECAASSDNWSNCGWSFDFPQSGGEEKEKAKVKCFDQCRKHCDTSSGGWLSKVLSDVPTSVNIVQKNNGEEKKVEINSILISFYGPGLGRKIEWRLNSENLRKPIPVWTLTLTADSDPYSGQHVTVTTNNLAEKFICPLFAEVEKVGEDEVKKDEKETYSFNIQMYGRPQKSPVTVSTSTPINITKFFLPSGKNDWFGSPESWSGTLTTGGNNESYTLAKEWKLQFPSFPGRQQKEEVATRLYNIYLSATKEVTGEFLRRYEEESNRAAELRRLRMEERNRKDREAHPEQFTRRPPPSSSFGGGYQYSRGPPPSFDRSRRETKPPMFSTISTRPSESVLIRPLVNILQQARENMSETDFKTFVQTLQVLLHPDHCPNRIHERVESRLPPLVQKYPKVLDALKSIMETIPKSWTQKDCQEAFTYLPTYN